jgi:glycine hydroxymethyltransferase
MQEPEMARIAEFIARTLRDRDDPDALAAIKGEVAALCADFPAYPAGA